MSSRLRRKNLGGAKQWHSSGDRETRNEREKYLIYKTERGIEREKKKVSKKMGILPVTKSENKIKNTNYI